MVRPLEAADIGAAAELMFQSWARSYADILPPDRHPSVAEHAGYLGGGTGCEGWVYDLGGHLAAVALVVGLDGEDPELSALHVAPTAQGAGVGTLVHDHVLDAVRAAGKDRIHLWVFRENGQARDFYHQRGWRLHRASINVPDRCSAAPAIRLDKAL